MADWKHDEKAEGSKNELEEKGIREGNLTPGSGLQMFTGKGIFRTDHRSRYRTIGFFKLIASI